MLQNILQLTPPPADERIKYGADPYHFGDLRLPKGNGPHPVVIVIHGGFWRAAYDLSHIGHLCEALRQAGLATWSLEYRRIGNPGGGWPGTFQDVSRGADHLLHIAIPYQLNLNRIAITGHSAGGHLALWLGARTKLPMTHLLHPQEPVVPKGIVSLAGVADLRRAWELKLSNNVVADLMGGSPEEVSDRYTAGSPADQLPFRISQKLIHGTADRNVPFEISERYVSAAKARGDSAELLPLDDAGHFELIDPRSVEFQTVKNAILSFV